MGVVREWVAIMGRRIKRLKINVGHLLEANRNTLSRICKLFKKRYQLSSCLGRSYIEADEALASVNFQ